MFLFIMLIADYLYNGRATLWIISLLKLITITIVNRTSQNSYNGWWLKVILMASMSYWVSLVMIMTTTIITLPLINHHQRRWMSSQIWLLDWLSALTLRPWARDSAAPLDSCEKLDWSTPGSDNTSLTTPSPTPRTEMMVPTRWIRCHISEPGLTLKNATLQIVLRLSVPKL